MSTIGTIYFFSKPISDEKSAAYLSMNKITPILGTVGTIGGGGGQAY